MLLLIFVFVGRVFCSFFCFLPGFGDKGIFRSSRVPLLRFWGPPRNLRIWMPMLLLWFQVPQSLLGTWLVSGIPVRSWPPVRHKFSAKFVDQNTAGKGFNLELVDRL